MVEAQHGGEIFLGQVGRRFHGDPGIGVGGVAHHQHLDVPRRNLVQGLALLDEDLGVFQQQILALHTGATGAGTDQQCVVRILEGHFGIVRADHPRQQRECAVFQFHHYALQGGLGLLHGQFQHLQNHGLVLAEHFARRDAEQQGISNLSGSAGDSNSNGGFGHLTNSSRERERWGKLRCSKILRAAIDSIANVRRSGH